MLNRVDGIGQSASNFQCKLNGTVIKINVAKTTCLTIQSNNLRLITSGDQHQSMVDKFSYFGSIFAPYCVTELDGAAQISRERTAFGILAPIWQYNNLGLSSEYTIQTLHDLKIFKWCYQSIVNLRKTLTVTNFTYILASSKNECRSFATSKLNGCGLLNLKT